MTDVFFNKPRPFSKRKRTEGGEAGSSGVRKGKGAAARNSNSSSTRPDKPQQGPRKGSHGVSRARNGSQRQQRQNHDEHEDEDDDDELGAGFDSSDDDQARREADADERLGSSEDEDDTETPAQKRLRLSQMYLASLQKDAQEEVGWDAAQMDRDIIAERLQQDVLEHNGKLHLLVADTVESSLTDDNVYRTPAKGHQGPVTAAVATENGDWLYTASKDGSIIKWDLRTVTSAASPVASTSNTFAATLPGDSTSTPPPDRARISRSAFFGKRIVDKPKKGKSDKSTQASDKGKGKAATTIESGHTDEVLSLAVSHDGKILASGSADKTIGVWDVAGDNGKWMRALTGHKDKVASITFQLGTNQLFSSSFDRTVKVFDLSTLSYIETLFGHQDSIQHIAALKAEVAVSAGGRDKTCRFWKIAEESQLVLRGGGASRLRNVLDGANEDEGIDEDPEESRRKRKERLEQQQAAGQTKFIEGSIEVVTMVDDSTFVSGGDSGSICLWSTSKKKPIASAQLAHGINEHESETEGIIGTPRWITAVGCLPYGDVLASGSWDGYIRLWKIDPRHKALKQIAQVAVSGFINSIQVISPSLRSQTTATRRAKGEGATKKEGLFVVASVSKEPRLGRWMKLKNVREGAVVVHVPLDGIAA
ncbi:pre-rRNA processing protein [Microbotryomycetes sp. JL221]|nr:pre-rRNA processing protein [Microbotryomycetes sp. JL221]